MTDNIEAKIEKLLRTAAGMANENESAVALQLAQKLADAHNLDIGTIGKTGARTDTKISKGLYPYQRTLYAGLAELNHCRQWLEKGLSKGQSYQIRLLGSKVNVAIVCNMADYLENAVNHMVKDRFPGQRYFSKDANAFRTGMVDTLVSRVQKKRKAENAEREQAKREQDARMRHPGAATENALVLISDVSEAETAANHDYLYGEGSWARIVADRDARFERMRAAAEQHAAWELAHPEEVAKLKAQHEAEMERANKKYERDNIRRERARQARIDELGYDPQDYRRSKPTVYDNDSYWVGRDKGNDVGLDDQINAEKRKSLS